MNTPHQHYLWDLVAVITFIVMPLVTGCQNSGKAPSSQERSVTAVESESKQHQASPEGRISIGTKVPGSDEWSPVPASNVESLLRKREVRLSCASITNLESEYPSRGSDYTRMKLDVEGETILLNLDGLRESLYETGRIKSTEGVFVVPERGENQESSFRTRDTCLRILYTPESVGTPCSEHFLSLVSGEDSSFVAVESNGRFVWAAGKKGTYATQQKRPPAMVVEINDLSTLHPGSRGNWSHLKHYKTNRYNAILEFTCHVNKSDEGMCGYPPDSDPPFDRMKVRYGYELKEEGKTINPLEVFDSTSGHCSTLSIDRLGIEATTIR